MSTTSESRQANCRPAQVLPQRPAASGRTACTCSCSPPPHPSALRSGGEAPADTTAASGQPRSPCAGSRPVQQQTTIGPAPPVVASLLGKPFHCTLDAKITHRVAAALQQLRQANIWSSGVVTLSAKMQLFQCTVM